MKKQLFSIMFGRTAEERRVGIVAALTLVLTALVSSLAVMGALLTQADRSLKDSMQRTLNDRSRIVLQELQQARKDVTSLILGRPHFLRAMGRLSAGTATAQDADDVQVYLDSIIRTHELSGVTLRDARGRTIGNRGRITEAPSLTVPLFRSSDTILQWARAPSMRTTQTISLQGRTVGQIVMEYPLDAMGDVLENHAGRGKTGETAICAADGQERMKCFPTRHTPRTFTLPRMMNGAYLPMHHAIEGHRAVITTRDYRGQTVIDAFSPIGDTGLGMVVKIDAAELYAPLLVRLAWLAPMLVLLIAGGVALLRWRAAPLVRDVALSRARLDAILGNAAEGIITFNARGAVEWFNPAATAIFGYEPQEIIGRDIDTLLPLSPGALREARIVQAQNADKPGAGRQAPRQKVGRHKNGAAFPVEIVVSAMGGNDDGGGFVAIVRDISERKRAEAALRQRYEDVRALNLRLQETQHQLLQSEKMASIGQLAAGVAHEINNPVGYVYSNFCTLENYLGNLFEMIAAYETAEASLADTAARAIVEQAREKTDLAFLKTDIGPIMGECREGITRVKKIVQDLKDFSRIDSSDEWQWADLQQGLDTTLNLVRNELKYKADIIKEYGNLPEIECLPSQLNQVFLNLLVNAGHAIETRGTITLRTGTEGDQVWVEIEDTGKGIAPEHLKRIFDPFFTTKPVGTGTGLGLSLSYSIVKKHHGEIDVASEPGKGTRFRIWLPITQQENLEVESPCHA